MPRAAGRKRGLVGFAALALLVAALASGTPSAPAAQSIPVTIDQLLAQVSERVPEFGGTYIDEGRGSLFIWSTEVRASVGTAAANALVDVLRQTDLSALTPVVLQANYTFAQLQQWHDRMASEVLALQGVVLTDIDDARNRLRVGVENVTEHRTQVEETLSALAIPSEAVLIEQVGPIRLASSLQNHHRPLVGGLLIDAGSFTCTLGFMAVRAGVQGFVTNSHCTLLQGGVENTAYGQHLLAEAIGNETADPLYFDSGINSACPRNRDCRYSDSAFARLLALVPFDQGKVAKSPVNSTAWNGTDKFRINKETAPLVGQGAAKVGYRTGRTIGTVTATGIRVNVTGTFFTFLSQAAASFQVNFGDSGAPVIRSEGPGADDVALKGILWGRNDADGTGFFSPIGNVQFSSELGAMNTCAPGITC